MSDISLFKTAGPLESLQTVQTLAMDTQNESIFAAFCPYEDCTITTVGFICASVTRATVVADDSYTVSIQTIGSTGVPDGTILGGGSPASATFPNATYPEAGFGTNTAHAIALDNSIALQRGTWYALVVRKTGATDLLNLFTLRYGFSQNGFARCVPYCGTSDATPTYTETQFAPIGWFVRSASKTYGWPIIASSTRNCGQTSEVGFSFTMPSGFGMSNSFGLVGIDFPSGSGSGLDAGATYTINLYSDTGGSNPVIEQTTGQVDSDIGTVTSGRSNEIFWPEDTLEALVPGTKYGVGIDTSGASGWSMRTYTIPAAGDRTAFNCGGLTVMTRTLASAYPPDASDGAFAEVTTEIVDASLIFRDFTAASGGGMRLAGSGGLASG